LYKVDSYSAGQEIAWFYGSQSIITAFRKAHHWTLSDPLESSPHFHILFLEDLF